MDANPTARHEALVAKRATLVGVNGLTFGEEIVDLRAEDLIDEFVLCGNATAEHRAMFGLAHDVDSARHAPDCAAHTSSHQTNTSVAYTSPSRAARHHHYALVATQIIDCGSQIPFKLNKEFGIGGVYGVKRDDPRPFIRGIPHFNVVTFHGHHPVVFDTWRRVIGEGADVSYW